jgi:uncharacterized protein (TIGR03435 family)
MLGSLAIAVLMLSGFGQVSKSAPIDTSTSAPKFQVATIKPSRPEESRTTMIRGNRFETTHTSVVDLIKYAYGLHEQEIVGEPKWLDTQTFDVVGDPETESRPSSDEFKKMVQNLLTDRFHLTAHHETRELSVLAIVQSKSGPNLTKTKRPPGGIPTVGYSPGHLGAGNATIADFASFLQRFVTDRPVVDQTGIVARYDFDLKWTPDETQTETVRQSSESSNPLPGLYTAIQEQLGLKLQEGKLPAQVLVIDHVETPSEN